jgi:hypothetical protein
VHDELEFFAMSVVGSCAACSAVQHNRTKIASVDESGVTYGVHWCDV